MLDNMMATEGWIVKWIREVVIMIYVLIWLIGLGCPTPMVLSLRCAFRTCKSWAGTLQTAKVRKIKKMYFCMQGGRDLEKKRHERTWVMTKNLNRSDMHGSVYCEPICSFQWSSFVLFSYGGYLIPMDAIPCRDGVRLKKGNVVRKRESEPWVRGNRVGWRWKRAWFVFCYVKLEENRRGGVSYYGFWRHQSHPS